MNKIVHDEKKKPASKPNSTTASSKAGVQFAVIDDLSELMMKSDATHYDFSNIVALITQHGPSAVQRRVFVPTGTSLHFQAS